MSVFEWPLASVAVTLTANTSQTTDARVKANPVYAINTTSGATAADGSRLSAVEDLEVVWSRPTAAAHQQGHESTMILRATPDAAAWLTYDAKVEVSIKLVGYANLAVPVLLAWVTSVTAEPLANGLDRYTVRLRNIMARASVARLGSTPWPREAAGGRCNRIAAAGPEIPALTMTELYGAEVRARDVDDQDALTLHQLTALANRQFVTENSAGIAYRFQSRGNELRWTFPGGVVTTANAVLDLYLGASQVVINANAVEGRPLDLTSAHTVTQVTLNYYQGMPDGSSQEARTYRRPAMRPSIVGSTLTLDTDLRAGQTHVEALHQLADGIIDATRTAYWSMPTTRLLLHRIGVYNLAIYLLPMNQRSTVVIRLDDAADHRIDRFFALTGGRFIIRNGVVTDYTVDLTPMRLLGAGPMRWRAPVMLAGEPIVGQVAPVRFNQLSRAWTFAAAANIYLEGTKVTA